MLGVCWKNPLVANTTDFLCRLVYNNKYNIKSTAAQNGFYKGEMSYGSDYFDKRKF